MKKAVAKVATVLRIAAGIVCAIFTVTFFVLIFTEEPVAVFIVMAVIFAGLTALLLIPRKKKHTPEPVVCATSAKATEPIDAYIETNGIVYRTDGKPISDREIPYLIETGWQDALCQAESTPIYRSPADQELIFKFTERHGNMSDKLTSKFEELAGAAYKTDDLDEKVMLISAAMKHFQAAREWHYKTSKGGMMWFQDMWEYGHPWAKVEADHLIDVLRERDYIRPYILKKAAGGFIQKDLYAELPDAEKGDIQRVIRQMEKDAQIIRTKKGGSYYIELAG